MQNKMELKIARIAIKYDEGYKNREKINHPI